MTTNVYEFSDAFLREVAKGRVVGHSLIHKFGANDNIGSTIAPVCQGGFYRTPQSTGTVELAVVSTSVNDTAAGAGAQEITLEYLDSTGAVQQGTIATNGTTESTETISGVLRLVRAWVSGSGTYASQSAASQQGTITIQVSGGGDTWAVIPQVTTGFGAGQSLIGAYTVPLGHTAFILSVIMTVDSGKSADLYFFKRDNILQTSAPYDAMRMQNTYIGIKGGPHTVEHQTNEKYSELTDIGFMAVGSAGTDVDVEFELLLIDNDYL